MFDLISIGDATIDNFVQILDAEVKCNLDKSKCVLCVEYGSKIAVERLIHTVGGNAVHSAIGAARLKLKTAIYVNIGDDPSGKQILEKLKEEEVDTKYVKVIEGMESNLSTILTFKGERTIFAYHQDWKYQLPDLEATKWVYFTSMSQSFTQSNLLNELSLYLQRTGAKLLYNPGTYQIQEGVKKYPKLLSLTEVFVVNKEEAEKILGGSEIKKLLIKIVDLGPKMVVITDGSNGSFGFDGGKFYHLGVFPANLVEKTGAGDAFATGVLTGLFYGQDLTEAMRWGAANSAAVVERVGPSFGLLIYDQMQEKLKENSQIIAKEI